ncbi:hypothetical protein [Neobacillus kokaensis]|uniref:Uncharacterized protein n=1 Tax=Neobacillus kokaensis TaxID=2759023 RepID=A0ABQ3N8C5_9BACI|nr:hypothetical protein [Neobacillus kokaensis]GHI00322.1 hypothetical protein AM1BK_38640 [Neobacillus kokaensis]
MELNYERALHLEGELVRFKKDNKEWVVGRVVKVREDGMEVIELNSTGKSDKNDGYGFGGFWRCCFVPFCWPIFPFLWW